MDFSRETGAALAWLLLFTILLSGALHDRMKTSAPHVVAEGKASAVNKLAVSVQVLR